MVPTNTSLISQLRLTHFMSLVFVPLFLIDRPFTEILIVNTIYVAYVLVGQIFSRDKKKYIQVN